MQFIDNTKIKLVSGRGGNGMVAWRREKYVDKGGPAGGDGGNGGDIYLVADDGLSTLLDFKFRSVFKADNGENGGIKGMHGKCAKHLYIKVPLGTVVTDDKTGAVIGNLTEVGQTVLIAKGGRGGRGNARFATPQKRAPQYCEPGEPGIERLVGLELKLISDIGLLGMPNAGKSTFISVVSSAKPKIADYPFTTLVPNLGVVKKPNGDGFVIADIPGLIEGASEGVGLGYEFLRHVERCRFLIHIVDITQDNPLENFKIINNELKKHSEALAQRYQIVVLNKIDAVDENRKNEVLKMFKDYLPDKKIFTISAATRENVDELMYFVSDKVYEIERPVIEVHVQEDEGAYNNDDSSFEVFKLDKNTFMVQGGKLKRLASVTDARNPEQIIRLQHIMTAMGVFEELKSKGIKNGDTLIIDHLELVHYDDSLWDEGNGY